MIIAMFVCTLCAIFFLILGIIINYSHRCNGGMEDNAGTFFTCVIGTNVIAVLILSIIQFGVTR